MNNLTPLIILLAITNKNGFNNIKNAIEAADSFANKIGSLTSIMNFLPNIAGLLNNGSQNNNLANLFSSILNNNEGDIFNLLANNKESSNNSLNSDFNSKNNGQRTNREREQYMDTLTQYTG